MSVQPHVLMLLDNGFAPDPRVEKEAHALVAAGADVTILAWDWQGGRPVTEVRDGYRVERIVWLSARDKGLRQVGPLAAFAGQAALRSLRHGFDVIYVHDFPLLPLGVMLSLLSRRPLIYDAHELYWLMEYRKYPSWITSAMRWAEVMLLKRPFAVITVSQQLAAHFRRFQPQVVVVGNWCDPVPSHYAQLRVAARRALNIPEEALCVGAIGGFGRRHVDCLIKATSRVPHYHALIAGRGTEADCIAELASQHPRAHYLGWRDNAEEMYASCDALYYGLDVNDRYSRYSSPNTLFRAISQGIPLLTTPIGEGGAVVRDSGCGLLLDPLTPETVAAAVQQLQDSVIYAALCDRARAAQAQYPWGRASAQLVQTVFAATGVQER